MEEVIVLYVDAFWMGVLITIVTEIILLCICAFVSLRKGDKENAKRTNSKRD